jgi:radical SAM-linked protein
MEKFPARIIYAKQGLLRYVSHRNIIDIFSKAVTRAGLPVVYSQGFNPKPRLSFYNPLQLGIASSCELMVIELQQHIRPEQLLSDMNAAFPSGLCCSEAAYVRSRKSIKIAATDYMLLLRPDEEKEVRSICSRDHAEPVYTVKARSGKKVRINDVLSSCRITDHRLNFTVDNTPEGSVSPRDFFSYFFSTRKAAAVLFRTERVRVRKERT